jgi:hypothetical protein
MMMRYTIAALAAGAAMSALAPFANAEGCNWAGCQAFTADVSVDVNVTLPDDFAAATASGSFTAGANDTTATATGVSSTSAAAANGGVATGTNTTTAGAEAVSGAVAGGSSTSSSSAGPAAP